MDKQKKNLLGYSRPTSLKYYKKRNCIYLVKQNLPIHYNIGLELVHYKTKLILLNRT